MSGVVRRLIPLADRVLVKRSVAATQSAGGILLPESAQKKENEGVVVEVGPGARDKDGNLVPVALAVGDRVLLPEYGGHAVKLGEEELQLFRDQDILGKFEG